MSNLVLVDLDGTLTDNSHRQRFLDQKPRDWEGWYEAAGKDEPHQEMISMVNALSEQYLIVIITARIESSREVTEKWLELHEVTHHMLIMRPTDNRVDDHLWKIEVARLFGLDNIEFVIEDRQRIVDAWRKMNVRCLQTDVGDF
jgi:FMN phosphatase YigB (HAD superfamily)